MAFSQFSNVKDFVIDVLIDKLDNLKGENYKSYACDLAYDLFEGENADGVYFYNNYKATEFIKEHFEDLGEIREETIKLREHYGFTRQKILQFTIDLDNQSKAFRGV